MVPMMVVYFFFFLFWLWLGSVYFALVWLIMMTLLVIMITNTSSQMLATANICLEQLHATLHTVKVQQQQ